MKVAINKQFIEGKLLTTEEKLQVIEDKIIEEKKELLEELETYFKHNGLDWETFEKFSREE